jgi:hypothetical protein
MLESVTYVPGMKCYPSIRKGKCAFAKKISPT